jgi:hypothetical protein
MRSVQISILTILLTASAIAGPPFKTDDPQPVDFGHWEFYVASQQSFQDHETDATAPHIEINFGAIPNIQLHIVAPLGYVHSDGGTHYGFSDTELGIKYRFIGETGVTPQVGCFPLVELPTGNADNQLGSGAVQIFLPVWIQKSLGKLTTYGGGGIWIDAGEGHNTWSFEGWEIQYDLSDVFTLGGELYYQTSASPDLSGSTGYSLGGFINLTDRHHLLYSIGRTNSGDNTITGYVAYQLTI